MATPYENLVTRKAAICVELAALTSSGAGGKPTYSADGESWDHAGYKKGLYDELRELNTLLAAMENGGGGAAYEVEVRGMT